MNRYSTSAFVRIVGAGLYFLAATAAAELRNSENSFGIIPMPFSIESKKESPFEITGYTSIVYQGEKSKACAEYLRSRIAAATGLKLAVQESGALNAIILRIAPDIVEFHEHDAYSFKSSKDNVTITGKSDPGLFYGVQTLLQLLPPAVYGDTIQAGLELKVPAVSINDKPSMDRIRGLHVDLARHFRTKEELFKIIDSMAMHKLNMLHIHLTDTQGWRVEIKAYPKLTTVGAIGNKTDPNAPAKFLTQEEVKEISAYARSRYISIIPEISMPGHMGAAIRAYPELNHPKDVKNLGFAIRGDAMARDFVKTVLTEINDLFDPVYIHLGVDEVNFGAKAELYTEAELVDFIKEITTFIKEELKKTPIVWDDIFMHGLHDKDVVVQWWRYDRKYWWRNLKNTVDEELNQRQQPFIFSPAYWTYFDMPNVAPKEGHPGWAKPISTAEVYNWDPFEDMFEVNEHTRDLALGAIACTWSERIKTMKDFGDRTYPRLAGFSERLWSGGKSENPSVLAWPDYRDKVLIPYQLDRYDALGVWYWSKDKPELLLNLPDARKRL